MIIGDGLLWSCGLVRGLRVDNRSLLMSALLNTCLILAAVQPTLSLPQLAVGLRAMPHESTAAGLQMAAVNLAQRVA